MPERGFKELLDQSEDRGEFFLFLVHAGILKPPKFF